MKTILDRMRLERRITVILLIAMMGFSLLFSVFFSSAIPVQYDSAPQETVSVFEAAP